ncbi:MAG: hypothetical protein RI894_916 [Bacteroidota bacterium]
MKKNNSFFLLLTFALLVFSACRNESKRPIPDVSHIKAAVKIERFERDLFKIDSTKMSSEIANLYSKYSDFADLYFANIMEMRPPKDEPQTKFVPAVFQKSVSGFINHRGVRSMYDTTQIVFKELAQAEKTLSQTMQFYNYYFPKKQLPKFYSFVSEYHYASVSGGDSIIGLGLDMFLGEKYAAYSMQGLEIPHYISRTLTPENLPVFATSALIDELAAKGQSTRMLDVMIQNGKKLYVLEQLMPYTADSLRFGYTAKQMDWCRNNERDMWAFFLDQKLIYNTNQKEFRRFTEPSPTTMGMPLESPGRTANYTGYQIVAQYMELFPAISLEELLKTTDAEKILKASKYKPKK